MWDELKLRRELDGPRGAEVAQRAVCALFRLQTQDEQAHAQTVHRNHVGFSSADAKAGTEMARWMDLGYGDGIKRRNIGGAYRMTNGTYVDRVELCKLLAWKYRGQLTATTNSRKAA